MADDLECPAPAGSPDWGSLYLYRGSEVVDARPVFTGDVFFNAEVYDVGGRTEETNILVLQHPCALRSNGTDLTKKLLVVGVATNDLLVESQWKGNYRLMPLPELTPGMPDKHYVGQFTNPYLATPDSLAGARRVACMTPIGVNILLQRWVYHNSRAAISTWKYDEATSAQYEEADSIEEWCEYRAHAGIPIEAATLEATAWLNDDGGGGVPRRVLLENSQYRASIRKAMRVHSKSL